MCIKHSSKMTENNIINKTHFFYIIIDFNINNVRIYILSKGTHLYMHLSIIYM